jgi:hypothetical protein
MCLLPISYPQEDEAVAAYQRGKLAFQNQDFHKAEAEFSDSFKRRNHPLTAYFLSYTYLNLYDFKNANYWATVSLGPMPPYTLDQASVDGAREIADYSKAQLAPRPSPPPAPGGVSMTTSAITVLPHPAVPGNLTLSSPGSLTSEIGVDRPGQDFRDFDLPEPRPDLCSNACASDARCKAFTYVKPNIQGSTARCWLKSSVPDPVQNDCCVSGIRKLHVIGALAASAVNHPDSCVEGFVWREASPTDHVCVTPEIRAETAADNQQADARRNPSGGPYGPDTCLEGYVWREAFPNDHVCVTPRTREQAAGDNSQARNRVAR